jgi:ribosomal protein L3
MLGLIGKKIGMTQVFDDKGVVSPERLFKWKIMSSFPNER